MGQRNQLFCISSLRVDFPWYPIHELHWGNCIDRSALPVHLFQLSKKERCFRLDE